MLILIRRKSESIVFGRRIELKLVDIHEQSVDVDISELNERIATHINLPLQQFVRISKGILATLVAVTHERVKIGIHCDDEIVIERGELIS
ncbi:MAG: carbon storage regulator [Planctomycetaceae bacterium]|nr:carbon storage regulator [Planctomycetaceae bacterium]